MSPTADREGREEGAAADRNSAGSTQTQVSRGTVGGMILLVNFYLNAGEALR